MREHNRQKREAGLPVDDDADIDEDEEKDEEEDADTSKDEESEEKEGDKDEDKVDEDDDEEKDEEKSEDDSKDDEDEDDDEESEDDEDDEDDESEDVDKDRSSHSFKKAVKEVKAHWKGKYNSEKEARKALETKLSKYETAVEEDDEEEVEEASEDVKELATKLGVEEKDIAVILDAAEKRAERKMNSKLAPIQEKERLAVEEKGFSNEWNAKALPELKKAYPKASNDALRKAQVKMKELAYSNDHIKHDMDYILFKEKKVFEKLLSSAPKKKGMESGIRDVRHDRDSDDEPGSKPLGPNPSPKEIRQREAYLDKAADTDSPKTRMTSFDDASGEFKEEEF